MSKLTTNVRLLSPAIKKKTAATLTAVVCAVLLPQLVHLCGIMSGSGNSLGEILLPMHLPVMIVGMLAGPVAGMAAGLISPLVSFALTGMPAATVLPFMCIELLSYGIMMGLLSSTRMPVPFKILVTQICGRAVRILATYFSFCILGSTSASVHGFVGAIGRGWIGIALQLVIVTVCALLIDKREKR